MPGVKAVQGLYVILDTATLGRRPVLAAARAALRGGAAVLQLRDKRLGTGDLYRLAVNLAGLTRRAGRLLIINDRVDVALAAGADGAHVGAHDLPVSVAKRILGKGRIVGASSHSLREAKVMARSGADYVAFGAVFPSLTKPQVKRQGIANLRKVARALDKPVVAIGGITTRNAGEVMGSGAVAAAVISAVLKTRDIEGACRRMLGAMRAA